MRVGVMVVGTIAQPGAELLSNSAGTISVKLKVEEVFYEFFPESEDAQLTMWVRGKVAWYCLASPHAVYKSTWEPCIQRTRLGEQVKAFLDKNPRATAEKMLQAVTKKGGYEGAGRPQKGKDRQPRGAEVFLPIMAISVTLANVYCMKQDRMLQRESFLTDAAKRIILHRCNRCESLSVFTGTCTCCVHCVMYQRRGRCKSKGEAIPYPCARFISCLKLRSGGVVARHLRYSFS